MAAHVARSASPHAATVEHRADAPGTLYQFDGSRLGGALLKRSVSVDYPLSFLTPVPTDGWREFLEVLESSLTTDDLPHRAPAPAERAFDLLEPSRRAAARKAA